MRYLAETGSRIEVTWGWGGVVLGFDGNRVSLRDEKVLGMDSDDGRTRHKHT